MQVGLVIAHIFQLGEEHNKYHRAEGEDLRV